MEDHLADSSGTRASGSCSGSRRPRSVWWLRGFVALLIVVGFVSTSKRQVGDLVVYTQAVDRAAAGEEAYVVEMSAFTHPPAQLTYFSPFTITPRGARRALHYVLNIALLFGVFAMLGRVARKELEESGKSSFQLWMWVVILAVTARHMTAPFENQSNDVPILFCMSAVAYLRGLDRDVTGSVAGGAATALKATPLLYLPILVWQRRLGGVISFVLAMVLISLSPDILFPRGDGQLWIEVWYSTFVSKTSVGGPAEAEGGWVAWNPLNQSLSGALFRLSRPSSVSNNPLPDCNLWSPSDSLLRATTMAAQVAVLGLIALAVGPPSAGDRDAPDRRMRRLGEVGAVVCGMVLLSPMSSKAHFCVLILPVTYLALHLWTRGRDALAIGCLATALALGSLTSKGLLGVTLGNALLSRGSVTWCTLAILLGVVRVARMRRRADRAQAAHVG